MIRRGMGQTWAVGIGSSNQIIGQKDIQDEINVITHNLTGNSTATHH